MERLTRLWWNGPIWVASALVIGCLVATSGCSGSGASRGNSGSGGAGNRGGSGGTSGGGWASLSGTASLGSLTPSQATQLCAGTYAYYQQAISQATLCKEAGLALGVSSSSSTDAQLQQNCNGAQAMCLTASPPVPNCSNIPTSCAATVAQYSACIMDQVAAFNSGVNALASCDTVTLAGLQAVWNFVTADPPASCASLNDRCPGLDLPTPHPGTSSSSGSGGIGGTTGIGGGSGVGGASAGTAGSGGSSGIGGSGGKAGATGSGGSISAGALPGDVAKAAGTPFVAAHAMTRSLFASYKGPLFQALRVSDQQVRDIGLVATTGLVDLATLNFFLFGDLMQSDDPVRPNRERQRHVARGRSRIRISRAPLNPAL